MFNYNNTRKTIKEISTMFKDASLIVDDSYQRRSVWGEKDKIRLVETVLLKMIIPELFFWKAETDPETGASITHIVDGQQRIKALCSFVNNEFKLKPQYLLDDSAKTAYGNKFFKDLDTEDKKSFWNYQLMVIDIDTSATREEIVIMFNRLNLTDYNLNDQEKRNSKSGEFASLAREISEYPIWEEYKLFTATDVKRMKDIEFCASLILLYRKGIIDQTDQTALNQAYEELQEKYSEATSDKKGVQAAVDLIPRFFIPESSKFLKKKTQLYTLFCVVFYILREKIALNDHHFENFKTFISLYSVFSNDMNLSDELDHIEKELFDKLKKYKLASSEGLNKHTNRMIRYNVMKYFIFNIEDSVKKAEKNLMKKMQDKKTIPSEDPEG